MTHTKPEIMSPAGYWPQLNAAIEAGADAVYFGLTHFSARAKVGFTLEELPDVMATLHRRGVKGYVTFNTLVFDDELREAVRGIEQIALAGADAIIVQDVGIAQLVSEIAPDLELHGSTQMSITSAEGVEFARQFGVDRVMLARELSIADMRVIRQQTDVPLEVFVHGALCVSYSGQCFSSEAWGGRSANRGQCAQACRLPYEMIVDGNQQPLGDARYLLSPGDLYAMQHIPDYIDIGVASLKIEGRYKDENYVALTTNAYRRAVDAAYANQADPITAADELALEQVYSRGMGSYFVSGTDHQAVVSGRSPRHRGVFCGTVAQVERDRVIITHSDSHELAPLKAGDGIVFDAANWRSPEIKEEGGRIYGVKPVAKGMELRFGNRAIDFNRIRSGDLVWRTHDTAVDKAAKPFTDANTPLHKQPLSVHVTAKVGQPLALTWQLDDHPEIVASGRADEALVAANKQGASRESLYSQIDRLGNTTYRLESLTADIVGNPFVPNSLLNRLRQESVNDLIRQQSFHALPAINDPINVLDGHLAAVQRTDDASAAPQLHLLVRTPEQLEAALTLNPTSITLDYLDLYGLRPAVDQIKAAGIVPRVASPRILKPKEQAVVNFLLRLDCAIVVRSSGLLDALQGRHQHPLIGDFSLNVANQVTANVYFEQGLTRITPTHDLNADQICTLARDFDGDKFEAVAYHHLPVFHTEHCVFCRFLSEGTSKLDCGQPCETHQVALQDVQGRVHPVMADVGCRNTVFGAEAQVASQHIDALRESGIAHYRLEFVHETADQVRAVTTAFADYFAGQTSAVALDQRLKQISPQGTTQGSLFVPLNTI